MKPALRRTRPRAAQRRRLRHRTRDLRTRSLRQHAKCGLTSSPAKRLRQPRATSVTGPNFAPTSRTAAARGPSRVGAWRMLTARRRPVVYPTPLARSRLRFTASHTFDRYGASSMRRRCCWRRAGFSPSVSQAVLSRAGMTRSASARVPELSDNSNGRECRSRAVSLDPPRRGSRKTTTLEFQGFRGSEFSFQAVDSDSDCIRAAVQQAVATDESRGLRPRDSQLNAYGREWCGRKRRRGRRHALDGRRKGRESFACRASSASRRRCIEGTRLFHAGALCGTWRSCRSRRVPADSGAGSDA